MPRLTKSKQDVRFVLRLCAPASQLPPLRIALLAADVLAVAPNIWPDLRPYVAELNWLQELARSLHGTPSRQRAEAAVRVLKRSDQPFWQSDFSAALPPGFGRFVSTVGRVLWMSLRQHLSIDPRSDAEDESIDWPLPVTARREAQRAAAAFQGITPELRVWQVTPEGKLAPLKTESRTSRPRDDGTSATDSHLSSAGETIYDRTVDRGTRKFKQGEAPTEADFTKLTGPHRPPTDAPGASLSLSEAISLVEAHLPQFEPRLRNAIETLLDCVSPNRQSSSPRRQLSSPNRQSPRDDTTVVAGTTETKLTESASGSSQPSAGAVLARELKALMGEESSLRTLASKSGVSFSAISKILNQKRSPDLRTLSGIAAAFGKSPRGLLFPKIAGDEPPLKARAAHAQLARALKTHLPNGSAHHQLDGILQGKRSPTLSLLEKLAAEASVPLADLLP